MILVENTAPNDLGVYVENLEYDASRSWSDSEVNIFGSGKIPANKFRLVDPLMPPFNTIRPPAGFMRGPD